MSKLGEIWHIIRRKDYKDGDEVHVVPFGNGFMVSNALMENLKPKLEEMPETRRFSDLYGVKIMTTPWLPYVFREAKKIEKRNGENLMTTSNGEKTIVCFAPGASEADKKHDLEQVNKFIEYVKAKRGKKNGKRRAPIK